MQREVGGNLAEILDIISFTIRERVRIKGEIKVLTSQVIYSGRFLAMMPLLISGALWLLSRPDMMEFFNAHRGNQGCGLDRSGYRRFDDCCWLLCYDPYRNH